MLIKQHLSVIGTYFPKLVDLPQVYFVNQKELEKGKLVVNPIVVGLFDSTILVGGGQKCPLPNS